MKSRMKSMKETVNNKSIPGIKKGKGKKFKLPKNLNTEFVATQWYHKMKRVLEEKPGEIALVLNGKELMVMEMPEVGEEFTNARFNNCIKLNLGQIVDFELTAMPIDKGNQNGTTTLEKGLDEGTGSHSWGIPGGSNKS